jgi:alpha-D-xyloside xylohydrolase
MKPLLAAITSLLLAVNCGVRVSVAKESDGVILHLDQGTLRLRVFSPRIVEVTWGPDASLPKAKSLAVIHPPQRTHWTLSESPDEISLQTGDIIVRVNAVTGAVAFFDASGHPLLAEKARGLTPNVVAGMQTMASRQDFEIAPREAFYGLGQHAGGLMNYRGAAIVLRQENPTESAVPVLVSSRGYGILWDNPAVTTVDLGKANPEFGIGADG